MPKKQSLLLLIVFYLAAGAYHFVNPVFYEQLMPDWLPDHTLLNRLSGIAEITFAVLLVLPWTQHFSAWMIALMLAVFFVLIHLPMAFRFHGWDDPIWWISILRLPIQYYLIRWALRFTNGKLVYFWGQNPVT